MKSEQQFRDEWIAAVVKDHVASAVRGAFNGRGVDAYFEQCRRTHVFRGISTGYHTSGWWKNPDYERCYHFSISFFDPSTLQPRPLDNDITGRLVKAFYTKFTKWVWVESPYSAQGKALGVWHYRLFCDAQWQPILPRGEVYSTELTEAGWKSFSDVQDAIATTGINPNLEAAS